MKGKFLFGLLFLGLSSCVLAQTQQEITELKQAAEKDVAAQEKLGDYYLKENQRDEAIKWLEKSAECDNMRAILKSMNFYAMSGEKRKQITWLRKAISLASHPIKDSLLEIRKTLLLKDSLVRNEPSLSIFGQCSYYRRKESKQIFFSHRDCKEDYEFLTVCWTPENKKILKIKGDVFTQINNEIVITQNHEKQETYVYNIKTGLMVFKFAGEPVAIAKNGRYLVTKLNKTSLLYNLTNGQKESLFMGDALAISENGDVATVYSFGSNAEDRVLIYKYSKNSNNRNEKLSHTVTSMEDLYWIERGSEKPSFIVEIEDAHDIEGAEFSKDNSELRLEQSDGDSSYFVSYNIKKGNIVRRDTSDNGIFGQSTIIQDTIKIVSDLTEKAITVLYNIPKNTKIIEIEGYFMGVSQDGSKLATRKCIGDSCRINVHKTLTGEKFFSISGYYAEFSPDGSMVLINDVLYSTSSWEKIAVFKEFSVDESRPFSTFFTPFFTPNGQYLVIANQDQVNIWDFSKYIKPK